MALTAASTRKNALDQYHDNLGYDIEGSVSKCKLFIEACRALLSPRFSVKRVSHGLSRGGGGEELETDQSVLQDQLASAIAWLKANDPTGAFGGGGGGVVYHEINSDFRG